jgi:hypothetical protein
MCVHIKGIKLILPAAVQLQPHLDAPKDHLFAALEVDAKLHYISVIDRERFRFCTRRA